MDLADKRGATRVSLFMRSVRVITESAQLVCILRDISATGARLKLFHPLPPLVHMAIDLGDGACHFMEKIWEHDGHAGFRFAAPIDIATVVSDHGGKKRQPVSIELDLPAVISGGGEASLAHIRELSQHGVRVVCQRPFAVGSYVMVGADGFPTRGGTVEWRSSPDHGVVFRQGFALDELARLAASLQGLPLDQDELRPASAALFPA